MLKNTAGQSVTLFAFSPSTGLPATNLGAAVSGYLSKDDGAVAAIGVSGVELSATLAAGLYSFSLTQGQTDANKIVFSGVSTASGVHVVPLLVHPRPANFPSLAVDASAGGVRLSDGVAHGGSSATLRLGGAGLTPGLFVSNASGHAVGLQSAGANSYDVHFGGALAVNAPAEASGRPSDLHGMARRAFEWVENKRTRDRATGTVRLRTAADDGNLSTQTQSTTGAEGAEVDAQTQGS